MQKIAIILFLCGTAVADDRIELGATLGGHAFSKNGELGVDDDMTLPGPESSFALGARAAYLVRPRLAVEGEALVIPTKDNALGDTALAFGVRAHARFDVLTGQWRPFLVGGLGMHVLAPTSPMMDGDADKSFHWGGGVRYALNELLELRFDARHLIVPDRTLDGATSDFEVTAGVTWHYGAKRRAKAPPCIEAPPNVVVTTEPDRDMDTIPDRADKCPAQPEDVDQFEDGDGCPELDNDQDGIADADDTCPGDKETKNGLRDDDGCPDQVIATLEAIRFEPHSAKLEAAAEPLIQHAYQLLTEYPGLSVEISGHTSAEGSADRSMELSLARAEVVKAALVKRGIAASRILTVGHGADKPVAPINTDEGRRKNRRIEFRILTPDEVAL